MHIVRRFYFVALILFTSLYTYAYDPLIIVTLMVKNEAQAMRSTLQPFIDGGIDAFLIFDTGSTDDTIAVTEAIFEEYNISRGMILQEPFVDFSTSRNRALRWAEELFEEGCFMLMPDAEWHMHNVEALIQFCNEHAYDPCPLYLVRILFGNLDYYVPRLMRCGSNLRFSGVVHESVGHSCKKKVPKDIFFKVQTSRYGIEKSKKRWARDRQLLLDEYERNPSSPRTVFYLAQTYACLGDWENACKWYQIRITMQGWDEENYMALYNLAKAYERLKNWEKALFYYLEAAAYRSCRAEPLVRLALHYWNSGTRDLCFLFARRAAELPYPESDVLFVEKDSYLFTRYDLLGRAAWYVGAYELGEEAVKKALKERPDLRYLYKNLAFYEDKIDYNASVSEEKQIVVITASYNNKDYYKKNVDSFVNQNYKNCRMIYIDDCSTDGTGELVEQYIYEHGLQDCITLIRNETRRGHLANQYDAIHTCNETDIIIILDGDDWFASDTVLSYINYVYADPDVWITYGQFKRASGCQNYVCNPVSKTVAEENKFRDIAWQFSHLRTFYAGLYHKIKRDDLMYEGEFFKAAADLATMYPMLEMAREGHIRFIDKVLLIYNDINSLNINVKVQRPLELEIRTRESYEPIIAPY